MNLFGQVAIHGFGGTVTHAAVSVTTDPLVNSMTVTNEADKSELMDGQNNVTGFATTNHRRRIQGELIPAADTIAHAKQAIDDFNVLVGTKMTVSGTGVDWVDSSWNIETIGAAFQSKEYVKVPFTAVQYGDNTDGFAEVTS